MSENTISKYKTNLLHEDARPNARYFPSECCSQIMCVHLPTVFLEQNIFKCLHIKFVNLQKLDAAGLEEYLKPQYFLIVRRAH